MTVWLTADLVGRINASLPEGDGINETNRSGVEGAVGRMRSGFGGVEAFPTIWDKAGALLHGLASTQCFVDGNKRTAWLAALNFLELNGLELPTVPDIEAEAAVLAIATASNFAEDKATEWLESLYDRRPRGGSRDPRLEYLYPALEAVHDPVSNLINVIAIHAGGMTCATFPELRRLVLVTRVHWRSEDAGRSHVLAASVQPDVDVVLRAVDDWSWTMPPPIKAGPDQPTESGVGHTPIAVEIYFEVLQPGRATLDVTMDDVLVGQISLYAAPGFSAPEDLSRLV